VKALPFPELYTKLRVRFGYLDWWPGETKDEIIIGAILTQQASWKNVEKAISNLKAADCLDLKRISGMRINALEKHIRPSGFYKQKAARLKGFARYVSSNYPSLDEMLSKGAGELREELLSMKGVGRETADSIILYAAGEPMFVIDAYTKRITSRIYGSDPNIEYDELRFAISASIPDDLELYKDFHAQFVELGKNYCKTKPLCNDCPVKSYCQYYNNAAR
jgi:endonuclease-3 related protein